MIVSKIPDLIRDRGDIGDIGNAGMKALGACRVEMVSKARRRTLRRIRIVEQRAGDQMVLPTPPSSAPTINDWGLLILAPKNGGVSRSAACPREQR